MSRSFDEIWKDILTIARSQTEIRTLVRKFLNFIINVNESKIVVQSKNTENIRNLLKDDFQYAWEKLVQYRKIILNDIEPELRGRKSIIFSFLEKLDYVDYKIKPLTLLLKEK